MVRNPTTIQEKVSTFQFETKHLYYVLAAVTLLTFFFYNEEQMIVPKWATSFAFLLMFTIAMGESWEAWRRKGSIIITTLGIGKGSNSGFNPSGDIRIARSIEAKKPNFAVIATGGFVYAGFSVQGKENFLIVPPEHVMQFYGNVIVKTRLRRVYFNQMPKYIQDELIQLPGFKVSLCDKKHNLWFGMTSNYYGTDTMDNVKFEQDFINKNDYSNTISHMFEDIIEKKSQIKDKPRPYEAIEVKDD